MGAIGASCFHDLSDQSRDLNKNEWDKQRFGWVCTSTDTFANRKEALEIFCQNAGCTYQVDSAVKSFSNKINNFQSKLKSAGK